jgi:hypothetical protein
MHNQRPHRAFTSHAPRARARLATCYFAAAATCYFAAALIMCGCAGGHRFAVEDFTAPVHLAGGNGLYITLRMQDVRSGTVDIEASLSSSDAVSGLGGARVLVLPCPQARYLVTVEAGTLRSGSEGTYSALLRTGRARLPGEIPCGHSLPAALGTSRLQIRITGGPGGPARVDFAITGQRLPDGNLQGLLAENVTLSPCAGRYRLLGTLVTPSKRRLVLEYPFTLTHVTGTPHPPPECAG